MKYEVREIRAAMTANSISTGVLSDYINQELESAFSRNYIQQIIAGTRTNSEIERVIEDLFGPWIEGQREVEKKLGGVMIPEEIINNTIFSKKTGDQS